MKSLLNCLVKLGRGVAVGQVKSCERQAVIGFTRCKHTVDYSRVPKLNEDDLEEMFVRGSGPGGQNVNKTNNCVVLTHKPTGVVVKCHQSRLQEENRREARRLLVSRLDGLLNGELSVEAQLQAVQVRKGAEKSRRQRKLQDMKREWKVRERMD